MELILTGRHFGSQEARELGVINAISAPGEVLSEARALADRVTAVSPSSVKASKRVLNDFKRLDYDLPESMKTSMQVVGDLMKTNDFKEGVASFVEKRSPNFAPLTRTDAADL